MNCTNCGSAWSPPAGYCGTCGQPTSSPTAPPAWQSDAITQFAATPHYEPHATPGAAMPHYEPHATPGMSAMPAATPYGQPPPSPFGPSAPLPYGPPPPYGSGPGHPVVGYPTGRVLQQPSNRLSIIAFILAGLALLILPTVLGLAGIAVGAVAKRREEPRAEPR